MILYLIAVILIAAACLLCVFIATQADKGCRCASPRRGLRADLAVILRHTGTGGLLPGPIVSDREVQEEWERLASRPEVRRHVNGRYLGTQPRRQGPFTRADMPTCPRPEPGPAWGDPGDGLGPQVPIARPWTADQVAYGVDRCQLDVAEAERRFALALGPDGCEQT